MKNKQRTIFFSGIAGSGVSAIAGLMAEKGCIVSGSDRSFDLNPAHPLKEIFNAKKINIVPQDGSGINKAIDLAVFSSAVENNSPEVKKAHDLKTQIKTRAEYLAEITGKFKTVAVAGTSGKSTTSGLMAFLMKELGYSPNFLGGGRVKQFRTKSNQGNYITGDSDILVIEACESDGTIVNYRPEHSILLNLSFDHNPVKETAEMFKKFLINTKSKKIINGDDKELKKISVSEAVTFSIETPSDYRPEKIEYHSFGTDFILKGTKFYLSMPGKYNLYNALSCIALLVETGTSLNSVAAVLNKFSGIERRFDIHLNDGRYLVIDDYAHNPHKISSMMETVKKLGEKICYIFQPHGFGPTRMMKQEYIETFRDHLREGDQLFLLPIFYAGGSAARDISSNDLADKIAGDGKRAGVMENRNMLFERLGEWQTYVVFGARDDTLAVFAEQIAEKLKI